MRLLALDTETTGLESENGHRIIEIGCVEVVNRRLTRNNLHLYVNPEREIDEGATRVHGMTLDDLRDKPKFAEVADQFLSFCEGAEIVIHNANFDVGFLNAELARLDRGSFRQYCRGVTDSLALARELYPGKRNSLDALCERYQVDNSRRTLHGALLDAEILAEVYVAMTRGQESLAIDLGEEKEEIGKSANISSIAIDTRRKQLIIRASEKETSEHETVLTLIQKESKGKCLWLPEPDAPASKT